MQCIWYTKSHMGNRCTSFEGRQLVPTFWSKTPSRSWLYQGWAPQLYFTWSKLSNIFRKNHQILQNSYTIWFEMRAIFVDFTTISFSTQAVDGPTFCLWLTISSPSWNGTWTMSRKKIHSSCQPKMIITEWVRVGAEQSERTSHRPLGENLISPRQELCLTRRKAGENFWNVPADFESTVTAQVRGKKQDPNFGPGNRSLYRRT